MASYTTNIPAGVATYSGWFYASANAGDEITFTADDAFSVSSVFGEASGATTTPGVAGSSYKPASGAMVCSAGGLGRVNFELRNYGGDGYFSASGFSAVKDFLIQNSVSGNVGVKHISVSWKGYAGSVSPLVRWVGECGYAAKSDSAWISATCSEEGANVVFEKNDTGMFRTANLEFTSFSGKTTTVAFTQFPYDEIDDVSAGYVVAEPIDGQTTVFGSSGGVFRFKVRANRAWQVVLDSTLLSLGASSSVYYGAWDSDVEVYIPQSGDNWQYASISLVSDINDEDYVFTVSRGEDVDYSILELTVSPQTVPAIGGTITVSITSNVSWDLDFEALRIDWGGNLPCSTGTGSATFEIEIPANTTGVERSGVLSLSGGGIDVTETVVQLSEETAEVELPNVELSPNRGLLTARGGTLTATITANEAAGALTATASSPWLSASVAGDTLSVAASKNTGVGGRSGAVTVSGENGGSASFGLTQLSSSDSDCVRVIPWSIADGAAYILLISTTDGAQTLSVWDAATKDVVATFDSDFPNESLGKIRYQSSNDVIWLVHPERPVRWVKREVGEYRLDGVVYSYKFTYDDYPFIVEPMLDFNVGSDTRLSLFEETWSPNLEYNVGDIVYNGQTYKVVSVKSVWLEQNTGYEWSNRRGIVVEIEAEEESFSTGTYVETTGITAYWGILVASEVQVSKIENPRGEIVGIAIGNAGTKITIETDVYSYAGEATSEPWTNYGVPNAELDNPEITGVGESPGFYECVASNEGEALSNESCWRRTFCVGKKMVLSSSNQDFHEPTVDGLYGWRIGQHLALTAKAYAAESGNWDYDAEGEVSNSLLAFGTVTLKTEGGIWSGRLVLEMSLDDGETWEFVDAVVSENGSANPQVKVDVDEIGALVRVRCDRREKATTRQALIPSDGGTVTYKTVENDTGCKWTLSCEGYSDVFVRIVDTHSDGYLVECISGCPYPVSTTTWAEGAWNRLYGYPQTVTIHEERLCFAGNTKKPTTLWCSAINHYDDFRRGTLDTSSLSVKPSSHSYGRAVWLASGAQLIMGTTLEEFSIGSRDSVAAMSGSNIVAKSSASYGSADFDCVVSKSGVFSVLPGGKKVGVLTYDAVEEYTGSEVSQKSEDVLSSGVAELSYVKAPRETLYALCNDGSVAVLTYDFGQNVAGWSQFDVLDGILSLCSIRRGDNDILVFVANDNGNLVLGEIDPSSDVWDDDGRNYLSECYPMPLEVSDNISAGYTGKITQADVYLTSGRSFEYSFDGRTWYRHRELTDGREWKELFGRVVLRQSGDWRDEATVMFRTDYPAPFAIAAVGAEIKRGS